MLATADFLSEYPEFAGVNADTAAAAAIIARALTYADAFLSNSAFGALRDRAIGLYTAHRLALRYKISASGIRSSIQAGVITSQNASTTGLTVTTQPMQAASSEQAWRGDYSRSIYGMELMTLIDAVAGGGTIIYSADSQAVTEGITTNAGMPSPYFP